jgi:hypothetical protein
VWILFLLLSASAAFAAAACALFLQQIFRILSFLFSCSLAAASADAAACSFSLLFFYSRIALSFTIKAALYNASVMLSGE